MARIALLTSEFAPFHGGIGAYARELAVASAESGHTVTVLAPDYGRDCTAIDEALPFTVRRFASGTPTMRGLPRRILETWRLLGRERFDIVHAADWPFFIPLSLARSRLRGARVLLTVHGTEIIYMQAPKRRAMLDAIGFWRPEWAQWIANSSYTANLLLKHFPQIPRATVRAIPLGVAPQWTAGRTERGKARAALNVTDDRIVIVSLGRVVPRKGHRVIADALARLAPGIAARIDWWVIGPRLDDDYAAALDATTRDLAVKTVFFGGLPDTDVRLRLSAADLFCLPGYQDTSGRVEGFGLVFLEAGAYGVPSIATRSGGIPEAVNDGVTGLLVPEHDPAALAEAITELVDDSALRARMGAAAQAKAYAATWNAVMRRSYDD
ncbi:glycosyltransferase family 4 protein [Novosphingobium sp. B-7]|uniref:glycosyltransferase family 4 protein n=1 Tax=Novosphingobium sp. B-7 TaxID=1298855 RepID=UPI0003B5F5EC|nr:glycosyltransferase family 4 protein [Novosphingobium sp. B-7]